MTESPVHEEMTALAGVEDCSDDIGGVLEVIDAFSDSSGMLRFTDDFGMLRRLLRCSTNRCLICLLNAFVPLHDQVRIETVARETTPVGKAWT